jgi:hypothetical protein
VGHINTSGNIVFMERKDGKLGIPLTAQLRKFLDDSGLAFSTHQDTAVVERSERLLDFLLEGFEPPVTTVKASYLPSE